MKVPILHQRGTTDNFFDNYDNWTLAWAYEESSNIRPIGTSLIGQDYLIHTIQ